MIEFISNMDSATAVTFWGLLALLAVCALCCIRIGHAADKLPPVPEYKPGSALAALESRRGRYFDRAAHMDPIEPDYDLREAYHGNPGNMQAAKAATMDEFRNAQLLADMQKLSGIHWTDSRLPLRGHRAGTEEGLFSATPEEHEISFAAIHAANEDAVKYGIGAISISDGKAVHLPYGDLTGAMDQADVARMEGAQIQQAADRAFDSEQRAGVSDTERAQRVLDRQHPAGRRV